MKACPSCSKFSPPEAAACQHCGFSWVAQAQAAASSFTAPLHESMMRCAACSSPIAKRALVCPMCNARNVASTSNKSSGAIVVVVLVVVFVIAAAINSAGY